MNSIDVAIVVTLVLFSALGVYWGLVRQVLALAGLVACVVLASSFGSTVAGWLSSFITADTLASWLGFIIVLLAVNVAASLVATLLRRFVGLLLLGWLDRIAGGVLGLVQAAATWAVLLIVAAAYPYPLWITPLQMSRFAPPLVQAFDAVFALLPSSFQLAATMAFGL